RGTASVAGYDIIRERKQIKRETGYMAQTFSLYPDLTVEENFRFFGGAYGVSGQAATRRMHALFAQIELEDLRDVQAGRLSGGMKQRRPLARPLFPEPPLGFLYTLGEGGTSVFVTTHYLDEAERCHAVGFMLGGRLIGHGEPRVLREQL